MRVLVIVHGFPPQAQGGSEIYAFEHARALAGMGHDIFVLTREQDPARPERAVRIEQRNLMRVAWVNNTFADTTDFADSYEHGRLADVVMPLIDEWAPDVAHIHHLTCLSTRLVFALADRGIPIVYTLHDYWLMCHRGQLLDRQYRLCHGPGPRGCGDCVGDRQRPLVAALKTTGLAKLAARALPTAANEVLASAAHRLSSAASNDREDGVNALEAARVSHMREVCRRISHFLAPSRYMRQAFVEFGIDESRITWSPYGFEHAAFAVQRTAPEPAMPLRLGFIGTLMVSKAPHVLLEAYRGLAVGSVEVHLYGASAAYHGDNSYHDRLQSLLALNGVHVHGSRPHADISTALTKLDVLVVPSVWPENSPLVIQEALMAGVPVVGSRIGGISELITDGENGFLFEPGNIAELSNILTRLANERTTLERLRPVSCTIRTLADDVHASVALYEQLRSTSVEPPPAPTRIAAVVVNYRTPDDTELALRALRASARPLDDIIGVNNDSQAVSEHLQTLATRWIQTGSNLGFSGGVNAGIREAMARGATHVMLVNSDVTVPPDTVTRLLAALESTPRAGIAGPTIASRMRPDEIASGGIRYSRNTGRMRHLRFGARLETSRAGSNQPSPRLRRSAEALAQAEDAAYVRPDAVSGCVMLVRREVFERAGFFEEDYFYGFEDIDFCITAAGMGFVTVLAPDAVVYHQGGQSIGSDPAKRLYFGARNHLLLASRLRGNDSGILRLARSVAIVLLSVVHAIMSRGGSPVSRLRAVARGVGDYASGKFGPDR